MNDFKKITVSSPEWHYLKIQLYRIAVISSFNFIMCCIFKSLYVFVLITQLIRNATAYNNLAPYPQNSNYKGVTDIVRFNWIRDVCRHIKVG